MTDGTTNGTAQIPLTALGGNPLYPLSVAGGWMYTWGWVDPIGNDLFRFRISDDFPTKYPTIDVAEYYHAEFNHYFMTGNSAEKALLDAENFQRMGSAQASGSWPMHQDPARRECHRFAVSMAARKRGSIPTSIRRCHRNAPRSRQRSPVCGERSRRTSSKSACRIRRTAGAPTRPPRCIAPTMASPMRQPSLFDRNKGAE